MIKINSKGKNMKLNNNLQDCINDLYKLKQLYKENFLIDDFLHDSRNKLCDCCSVNKNESKIITRWLNKALDIINDFNNSNNFNEKVLLLNKFLITIDKLINKI